MKRDDIKEILDSVDIINKRSGSNYVAMACPFAKYSNLHKHDHDINQSGYVRVSDDEVSYFGCWTCEFSGNMWKLFKELKRLSQGSFYDEAYAKVSKVENKFNNNVEVYDLGNAQTSIYSKLLNKINLMKHPIIELKSLMVDVIDEKRFRLDTEGITDKYLETRGYSPEDATNVCDKFNFRLSTGNDKGIYIAKDFKRNVIGYMIFHLGKRSEHTKKYIVEYTAKDYLINEEVFYKEKFNSLDVIVAEGLFDVTRLSLVKYFKKIVGLQGKIKEQQIIKILYFSKRIFFFTDLDPVGIENVKKLKEYYEKNYSLFGFRDIRVFDDFSEGDDPDSFFQGENDIKSYDFKNSFLSSTAFLDKYKYMIEPKKKEVESDSESNQAKPSSR